MHEKAEITLDFDHTVGTEDRFVIRHFVTDFVEAVNNQGKHEVAGFIADSATAEGFSEFALQKPQLVEMFYKKFFGRRHNYISLPKLKLTSSKFLFRLNGNYEEYQEGILSAAGSIDLSVIKQDEKFYLVSMKFYPRMRVSESI